MGILEEKDKKKRGGIKNNFKSLIISDTLSH